MTTATHKFESPIEEKFAEIITPALLPHATIDCQVPVKACGAKYRLDFVISTAVWRLAVECDGREFHNPAEDYVRDLRCLNDHVVDGILRLRGCDIFFNPDGVLHWTKRFSGGATADAIDAGDSSSLWLAALSMRGGHVRPTYRGRLPLDSLYEHRRELEECDECEILGRTSDGRAAVQLRHSNWNWHYSGPRTWSLGDRIKFDLERNGWSEWIPVITSMMADQETEEL